MKAAPIPDHIGRYQILERVGRGGMGVLYRGFDPKLDREVAIKVMLTDFSEDAEQMRPRFYREAKAVAKLQHRNIVTVFEFVEDQNQPHIVMEFLRGVPLGSRMSVQPPLTLDDKLDIVAQLCAGLGYAHSQGVVHRDVKPANVFLLEDGTVKLLDFGIAKLTTSTLTRQGDVLGSASYMSPEQVAGSDSVDGRADVWSTGVLLYELLAGRKPFEGQTPTNVIVKILKEEPPPIENLVPGLPKQLAAAVNHALQKDPAMRFAKADELGRELQWIRKALQASGDFAPMEETKYASTQLLKALGSDLAKQPTGAMKIPTVVGAPAEATLAVLSASNWKWIIPLGATAVVAAAVGGYLLLGGTPPVATTANASPSGTPPAVVAAVTPDPTSPAPAPAPPPPNKAPAQATDPVSPKTPAVAKAGGATESGTAAVAGNKPVAEARKSTPAASLVKVSISAPYAFEIFDGARSISPAGKEHELPPQPAGKTLRVVAPDVFLDRSVRVEGGPDNPLDLQLPALGTLSVRATRGTCKIMLGKRDLGDTSVTVPIVAGEYTVSLSCPDGQNPTRTTTVNAGATARVTFLDR